MINMDKPNNMEIVNEFTLEDVAFIQDSLSYTRKAFDEYEKYPLYEYKQKRLADVAKVAYKLQALNDKLKLQ
jgi:hypothetical protein